MLITRYKYFKHKLINRVHLYLRNLCDDVSLYRCKRNVFQLLARNGRNEIEVVRLVQLTMEILAT